MAWCCIRHKNGFTFWKWTLLIQLSRKGKLGAAIQCTFVWSSRITCSTVFWTSVSAHQVVLLYLRIVAPWDGSVSRPQNAVSCVWACMCEWRHKWNQLNSLWRCTTFLWVWYALIFGPDTWSHVLIVDWMKYLCLKMKCLCYGLIHL
jgi:hypothetical protein